MQETSKKYKLMKTKTIPFDAKMAKDIQDGKNDGKIKTRDSKDVDEIVFFGTPLEYKVYAVINGRPHSFTERGFERSWDKSGKWHGDLVIEVPDNEPQFKPFDKVLVRNEDTSAWTCAIFSHHINNTVSFLYAANSFLWKQCIPYEGNEHLVGTTDKPKED